MLFFATLASCGQSQSEYLEDGYQNRPYKDYYKATMLCIMHIYICIFTHIYRFTISYYIHISISIYIYIHYIHMLYGMYLYSIYIIYIYIYTIRYLFTKCMCIYRYCKEYALRVLLVGRVRMPFTNDMKSMTNGPLLMRPGCLVHSIELLSDSVSAVQLPVLHPKYSSLSRPRPLTRGTCRAVPD